jgi:hypothetical protein
VCANLGVGEKKKKNFYLVDCFFARIAERSLLSVGCGRAYCVWALLDSVTGLLYETESQRRMRGMHGFLVAITMVLAGFIGSSQPPAAEQAAAFTWLKHIQKEMRTTYKDVAAIATDPHQSTKKNVGSRVGAVLRARPALPAGIRSAVNSWKGKNMDKKQKALKKQLTTDQKKMIASYRQLAIIASYTGDEAKAQRMLDAAKKIEVQTGEKLPLPLMGEGIQVKDAKTIKVKSRAGKPKVSMEQPMMKADRDAARGATMTNKQKIPADDDKSLSTEISGVEAGGSMPVLVASSQSQDELSGISISDSKDDDNDKQLTNELTRDEGGAA